MKVKLATPVLVVLVGLSFSSNVAAQTASVEANGKSGSICVLPNSPEPPTRISPGGEYNPDTLGFVSIKDSRSAGPTRSQY